MTQTTVIHVKDLEPGDLYIGRANRQMGMPASKWANPHKVSRVLDRGAAIELYRRDLMENPTLLAALPELRGRRLACWCAPLACHGDVLAALANALDGGS